MNLELQLEKIFEFLIGRIKTLFIKFEVFRFSRGQGLNYGSNLVRLILYLLFRRNISIYLFGDLNISL